MFIEGANSNIVNSCVTLITQELKIENPTPIILLILFVTVPGSMSAPHLQRKLGVKGAFLFIILVNVFSTLFIMFFCYSPETANRVFVAALFFGVGIGSTYPIQRTLFYKLSPFGQENEMMGIFQACSMIIQFLPALAFTGINQLLGSVRWAMGSLVLFWSIGWGFVYMIDFEKGVADAEKTAHLKYNNSGGSTSAKVGSAIADAFRNGSMRAK
jgi:MFS-type transporter involved in bile tolerance (Atg22 family)